MPSTTEQSTSGIRWVDDEEAHAIFDAEARRLMGMTGEEFPRRYDAGDFADIHADGENVRFTSLEMLITFGR